MSPRSHRKTCGKPIYFAGEAVVSEHSAIVQVVHLPGNQLADVIYTSKEQQKSFGMWKGAFGVFMLTQLAHNHSQAPIIIHGGGDASFTPAVEDGPVKVFNISFGNPVVVVVGSGLAGLTSAFYLTEQGLKVFLIEKEGELGGLTSGGKTKSGFMFGRGAAYWTAPYAEEENILKDIGLSNYNSCQIEQPIDGYLWDGRFYPGIWGNETTMDTLPQSFRLFRFELERVSSDEFTPNQPIEEASTKLLDLDRYSAAEWIKSIPKRVLRRTEADNQTECAAAKSILTNFEQDERVHDNDGANGMQDVLDFLNLYARSAFGTLTDQISALAFINFYSSEIVPRYTSQLGTGIASETILARLNDRRALWQSQTSAAVIKIEHKQDSNCAIETTFVHENDTYSLCSKYVVFAAQLKFAPEIITSLEQLDPDKVAAIRRLSYFHYSVHVVQTTGHPLREAYDTWIRNQDYRDDHFTDLILGRWMHPQINGYREFRQGAWRNGGKDYTQKDISFDNNIDQDGILTIYHPLPKRYLQHPYDTGRAKILAQQAVVDMIRSVQPMTSIPIEVKRIDSYSWPYSIQAPGKNFFSTDAKILRRKTGHIFFAHSNIGTPAFEEALFRGHCAAHNILTLESPGYRKLTNTSCPIEH